MRYRWWHLVNKFLIFFGKLIIAYYNYQGNYPAKIPSFTVNEVFKIALRRNLREVWFPRRNLTSCVLRHNHCVGNLSFGNIVDEVGKQCVEDIPTGEVPSVAVEDGNEFSGKMRIAGRPLLKVIPKREREERCISGGGGGKPVPTVKVDDEVGHI